MSRTKRLRSMIGAAGIATVLGVGALATPAHAAVDTTASADRAAAISLLSQATGMSATEIAGHEVDPYGVLGPLVNTPEFWWTAGAGFVCAGHGSVSVCIVWGS